MNHAAGMGDYAVLIFRRPADIMEENNRLIAK